MSGTLNKVMLIGHLGDEVKCIILKEEIALADSHWPQMKFILIRLQMKKSLLPNGII
jgi:hypothetical protein